MSFKVDQRDKPIKCNRESPSASFPVEKGPGPKEGAEKLFLPLIPAYTDDRTHKFQKSKTSLAPMRIRGASKVNKKIRDGSTCTYIHTYACMYIHRILACRISHGNHSYCTNKMADGFRFRLCDAAAVRI